MGSGYVMGSGCIICTGCIITRILKVDVRDEFSVSRPSHFNPEEEVPCSNWMRNSIEPKVGLEALEKPKISFPYC
jgi:hypothetical protein